jgi:VanZ family protein
MNRRRLIFVLYVAALVFATHCSLRWELRSRSDSWYHAVLDSIERLTELPLPGRLGHLDKVAHLAAYALLTFLAFRAVEARPAQARGGPKGLWRVHPIAIVLMLLAFGVADETTQPFFARTLDCYDYAADVVGIIFATTCVLLTTGARADRASWRRPAPVEST